MADLKIVISALNKASGDLNKVKQDISGVKDAGEKGGTAVQGFGDSLSGLMGKAALVAGVVAGVGLAMKEVYESAKEAAELDYARDKFDALTDSIGTTSHALLVDLRDATSGLVSDAELVESAGQMMALGLASTHEEATRLATVAGELDMNMNQLVLTLTNQTTMRFDALGVSVAGFDEKVKALEESGLSAQEAFSEAFLQQAEEQIRKVGSVADSSVGSFKLMESGIKNLADAAKANLLDVVAPAIEKIGSYLARQGMIAQAGVTFDNLVENMSGMLLPTTKLQQEWTKLLGPNGVLDFEKMDEFNELILTYSNYAKVAEEGTQGWADANYEGEESVIKAQIAVSALNKELEEAKFSMDDYIASVTSSEAKFRFLTKNSGTYSDLLTEIETKQGELANMQPWEKASESGRELQGEIDILLGKLDDLGEAMKMDALKTAIEANGDVTEQEYQMMLDYMEQAGMISSETNKEMMKDWRDLNQFQQNLRWDAEGNIIMITDDALASIEELKEQLRSIERNIGITVNVSQMGQLPTGKVEFTKAVGGAVYGGNPYTWQEYGYKGELFVPSSNGFVLSRADAERSLSRALAGDQSALDPDAIGKAVARALSGITSGKSGGGNVYNLTMPTSSNPADVRTAFELMEAWGA